jgi:3-oxoacyl-[acyl-carrier protein] reductase
VTALAEQLQAEGARVHVTAADLTDAAAASNLVADMSAALGVPDTLVASLGGASDKPLMLETIADLDTTLRENLGAVVNLVSAFLAARGKRRGGRIVLVTSITGLVGQPMRTAYAAAKGAVIAYAKSIAREQAAHGMTVNCIAPQVVEGGLAEHMRPAVRRLLLANTPLERACAPAEIAAAAVWLASPGAAYATGTVENLSGGLVTW